MVARISVMSADHGNGNATGSIPRKLPQLREPYVKAAPDTSRIFQTATVFPVKKGESRHTIHHCQTKQSAIPTIAFVIASNDFE